MTGETRARLVILISGNGSNLQAVLEASKSGYLPADITAVISNRPDAYGLIRALNYNIPTHVLQKTKEEKRQSYDTKLADLVSVYQPDWVILAGWMRLLSSSFLNRFSNKVVNLHPALPGTFPGTDAIERAYHAFQKKEITQTGVMVHLVPDEGVDNGPLLNQEVVPIHANDTIETLEERIHQVEHRLFVDTIRNLLI